MAVLTFVTLSDWGINWELHLGCTLKVRISNQLTESMYNTCITQSYIRILAFVCVTTEPGE